MSPSLLSRIPQGSRSRWPATPRQRFSVPCRPSSRRYISKMSSRPRYPPGRTIPVSYCEPPFQAARSRRPAPETAFQRRSKHQDIFSLSDSPPLPTLQRVSAGMPPGTATPSILSQVSRSPFFHIPYKGRRNRLPCTMCL